MILKLITDLLKIATGLAAFSVGVTKFIQQIISSKNAALRRRSAAIEEGLRSLQINNSLYPLLCDCQTETFLERMMGIPVPLSELESIIQLHRTGKALISEIAYAWRYKIIDKNRVSFALPAKARFFLIFSKGLILVCLIIITVSFIAICFESQTKDKIILAGDIAILASVIYITNQATQSEKIAADLQKRLIAINCHAGT